MMRFAAAVVVAFALAFMTGLIAQDTKGVFSSPAQGFIPATTVVSQYVPDKDRVCAEPKGGGVLSCRTVAEFRKWVMERPLK
jgi:hypothetical protein